MDTATLVDRVYQELRQRILKGEFAPGDKLNLTHLAAELNVSNTPLREAVAHLERVGLVEIIPYCGPRVKALNPDQVADIFDVRMVLEELAVRLAAQRADMDALRALEAAIETQKRAYRDGDAAAFNAADRTFHEALVKASKNSVLLEMLPTLSDRVQLLIESYDQRERPNQLSIEGHECLLHALKTKQAETAVEILKEQLLGGKRALLAYMAQQHIEGDAASSP